MSKHIDRQLRLERLFISRLNEAYSMASICHYSQAKLSELKNTAFYAHCDRAKLTRSTDSYLQGYDRARFEHFRSNLVYGYRLNGEFLECRSEAIQGKHQIITELNLPCLCVYREDTSKEF